MESADQQEVNSRSMFLPLPAASFLLFLRNTCKRCSQSFRVEGYLLAVNILLIQRIFLQQYSIFTPELCLIQIPPLVCSAQLILIDKYRQIRQETICGIDVAFGTASLHFTLQPGPSPVWPPYPRPHWGMVLCDSFASVTRLEASVTFFIFEFLVWLIVGAQ